MAKNLKRFSALFMAVLMVVTMLPISAMAEGDYAVGDTVTASADGSDLPVNIPEGTYWAGPETAYTYDCDRTTDWADPSVDSNWSEIDAADYVEGDEHYKTVTTPGTTTYTYTCNGQTRTYTGTLYIRVAGWRPYSEYTGSMDGSIDDKLYGYASNSYRELTVNTTPEVTAYYVLNTTAHVHTPDTCTVTEAVHTFTLAAYSVSAVSIRDDILNSGSLVADVTGNGPDSVFTYQWYDGSGNAIEGATGKTLYVAKDGARQTYTVSVSDGTNTVNDSYQVPYYDALQNGSFETPVVTSGLFGVYRQFPNGTAGLIWQTTASDRAIEVVRPSGSLSSTQQYYRTTTVPEGSQFAELNAEAWGALYQDVLTEPGSTLYWGLMHSGRMGSDTMQVVITDASGIPANWNPANQSQADAVATITDGSDDWNWYQGSYVVPEGQYVTRFYFISVSAAGGATQGNLLDDIQFSRELPAPPPNYISYQFEYYVDNVLVDTERSAAIAGTIVSASHLDDYAGYIADAGNTSNSSMEVSADSTENVRELYFTTPTYTIEYYAKAYGSGGYTQVTDSAVLGSAPTTGKAPYGTTVTIASIVGIPGSLTIGGSAYTKDHTDPTDSFTMSDTAAQVVKVYYNEPAPPTAAYTFNYYVDGQLNDTEGGSAIVGTPVSATKTGNYANYVANAANAANSSMTVSATASENVRNLYYTTPTYTIEYYAKASGAVNYVQVTDSTVLGSAPAGGNALYNSTVNIADIAGIPGSLTIDGKTYAKTSVDPAASLTMSSAGGNVIRVYYDENLYGYTVQYMESGTTTKLAADKTVSNVPAGTYNESPKTIPGYVAPVAQDVIVTGDGQTITFYYTRNTVTLMGTKSWNGTGFTLPASITVSLKTGDEVVSSKTVTANDQWKYQFTADQYTYTKDSDGYITGATAISYTIEETAIDGAVLDSNGRFVVYGTAVTASGAKEVLGYWVAAADNSNLTNTWIPAGNEDVDLPGSFSVKKVDSVDTSKTLPGAVFRLSGTTAAGVPYSVTSSATGADGIVTFSNIPVGTYTLAETTRPVGYREDTTTWTITVSRTGNKTLVEVKQPTNTNNAFTNVWNWVVNTATGGSAISSPLVIMNTLRDYTVSYAYEGTVPADAPAVPTSGTAKMGDTVTVADDAQFAGYTFTGWHTAANAAVTVADDDTGFTMPAADVTLYGSWAANTGTPYTVEYYYQVNGQYPGTADASDDRTGTTDTTANVTDADKTPARTGYVLDDSAAGKIYSGNIAGNGSLVLKVYFKQQFTVTYKPGTQGTFTAQSTGNLDYGTATPVFVGETTGNAGYHFTSWAPAPAQTVTESAEYVAQWAANTNTPYTVEYYYQVNGQYPGTADASSDRTGTTDTTANVTDADKTPTRSGYVYDTAAANVESGNIAGNGSLVLKVYFKQQFTVIYKPGTQGTFTAQSTGNLDYGTATPAAPNTTGNAGYTFAGWAPSVAPTVTKDAEYVAQWTANDSTTYRVEYYYQVDGQYPGTATSFVQRTGTTDTTANVTDADKIPSGTGYVLDDSAAGKIYSGNIAGDNSLVLKVYFKQQFTVTYEPGVGGNFEAVKHDALDYGALTPAAPDTPAKAYYVFTGWDKVIAETVTENVVYVAQWSYQPPASYYNVTVNYIDKDSQDKIADSYVSTWMVSGSVYNVTEQAALEIEGYTLDSVSGAVTGYLNGFVVVNVYYTADIDIDPPTPPLGEPVDLLVHYVDENGNTILADFTAQYVPGESYTVTAPSIPDYTYKTATGGALSGTIETDVEITLIYTKNAADDGGDIDIDDPDVPKGDVPKTGDSNTLSFGIAALAALVGMILLHITGKKKKEETNR